MTASVVLDQDGYAVSRQEQRRREAKYRDALRALRSPQQQLEELDAKLGKGQGAKRERARLFAMLGLLFAAFVALVGCVPNQDQWPAGAPEPNGTMCWHSNVNYLEVDCNTAEAARYAGILYQPWPSIEVIYVPGQLA